MYLLAMDVGLGNFDRTLLTVFTVVPQRKTVGESTFPLCFSPFTPKQ